MSDIPLRTPQVTCEVTIPVDVPGVGKYANAFRILQDTGDEMLLDFVVYSAATDSAVLVSRIRITKNLIPAILARVQAVAGASMPNDAGYGLPIDKDKIN